MSDAIRLALDGRETTLPNPMVGAVLVQWSDQGPEVVGRGAHRRRGGPHAEIFALRQAGIRARGATCYVSLEPCSHTGKTGPCADALIEAGVSTVVFGVLDPNPLVRGSGIAKLRAAGIEVRGPVLEDECAALNAPFFHAQRTKSAWVTLKLALTLDGYLCDSAGSSAWLTGPSARKRVHQLRAEHQAVMVGAQTVRQDNPRLTIRDHAEGAHRSVTRVIVTNGDLDLRGGALMEEVHKHPVWLYTSDEGTKSAHMRWAQDNGARVQAVDNQGSQISLSEVLKDLVQHEIISVFCEGGAGLAGGLLSTKLANRLHIFRAPKIFGAQGGRPGIADLGVRSIEDIMTLQRGRTLRWDQDIEEIFEISNDEAV